MQKRLSLLITVTLALFIAIGAVADTASAIERCLPKACCCSKAGAHGATSGIITNATSKCHGNSPCCQIEPLMPFPEMAIVTTSESPHPKIEAFIVLDRASAPQTQAPAFANFYFKAGKLKIPPLPLYLQYQSFLC